MVDGVNTEWTTREHVNRQYTLKFIQQQQRSDVKCLPNWNI